jgi:hypothetical protein
MTDELIKPTPATNATTLEPGAADRRLHLARAHARSAERLAAALALIAGFVDAYGMITYGVYVSFMSGNTTQTGLSGRGGRVWPRLTLGSGDPVLRRRIVRRDLAA